MALGKVFFGLVFLSVCGLALSDRATFKCPLKKYGSVFDDDDPVVECPGKGDPDNDIFCCYDDDDDNVYCCDSPFKGDGKGGTAADDRVKRDDGSTEERQFEDADDDDIPLLSDSRAEKRSVVKGVAKLIGIILGLAAFVTLVCVVCCCCCPFCLLHKRKHRGHVIRQNEPAAVAQPLAAQPQIYSPPQQQPGYPPQQHPGYPPQQQPGYPPQQQPGYPPLQPQPGYPPQQPQPGYPPQQPQPGYPPQQQPPYMPEQPPPYPGPPGPPATQTQEYQKQPAFNPSAP